MVGRAVVERAVVGGKVRTSVTEDVVPRLSAEVVVVVRSTVVVNVVRFWVVDDASVRGGNVVVARQVEHTRRAALLACAVLPSKTTLKFKLPPGV